MKILHVGQMIGGLDVYIRNSITYSDDSFDFVIAHGVDDQNKPVIKNGETIKEYKISLFRSLNPLKDLKGLIQTIQIIRKEKPDIIHCHSAKGGFIGRLAGFITGIKTFYTPHAFSFLCTSSPKKKGVFLLLEKTAKLNSYLLACSESERQMGIDIVGYKESHALVWHNSVPDASLKQGHADITDGKYISYIGRPCYQKNPFFLLDIIKRVSEKDASIHFYLLGVGYHSPDLVEMKRKIEELHIEQNIVLVPWLNHEDCLEYVKHSMFYLTCSLYEGLPLSVIEAMSLGKAVIASDVVGNRDCVANEQNGFLLPLNAELFADKIIELSTDIAKRETFGKESRDMFIKSFMIDNQIKYLSNIYRNTAK